MVDTTIPGTSAELVEVDAAAPLGSAGIIAIVGSFEKGDENTPYYARNANEALELMGDDPDYSGSKIVPLIFKQDPENNNYGATSAILINAGAREGASCALVDTTSPTAVTVMTLHLKGGVWGNSVTATIATGSIAGKKLTLMNGTEVIEIYDNISNATALYNKLRAHSSIIESITVGDLTKTLKDVSASPFAGGTETASPTTSDITAALLEIQNEDFDILVFTDIPEESYIPSIIQYLEDRFDEDNASGTIIPMDSSKTVVQARTLAISVDNMFVLGLIYQTAIIGTEQLNEAETAARYAGYVAGMVVSDSPTNKIISDITGINTNLSTDEEYALTDAGVTLLKLKNRKDNKYGIISAVTTSQDVDGTGSKKLNEIVTARTLAFVSKYMNVKDWLGRSGSSKSIDALEGKLNNRKQSLLDEDIAQDITIVVSQDISDDQVLIVDIGVKVQDVIKHIHKRVKHIL